MSGITHRQVIALAANDRKIRLRCSIVGVKRKTAPVKVIGHTRMENTASYLGVELEDALSIADAEEI